MGRGIINGGAGPTQMGTGMSSNQMLLVPPSAADSLRASFPCLQGVIRILCGLLQTP